MNDEIPGNTVYIFFQGPYMNRLKDDSQLLFQFLEHAVHFLAHIAPVQRVKVPDAWEITRFRLAVEFDAQIHERRHGFGYVFRNGTYFLPVPGLGPVGDYPYRLAGKKETRLNYIIPG